MKTKSDLDAFGHEVPDPRQMALPLGFKKPETLNEQITRLVRGHLSRLAEEQGYDSFEDADDFDVEDDVSDPATPFEMEFDPILGREISPDMLRRDQDEYRKRYVEAARNHPAADADIEEKARRRGFSRFWRAARRREDGAAERPKAGGAAPSAADDDSAPT